MIDGAKLAGTGFRYLGTPYESMDCQAFVEQCLRDCGLEKNLAGSNAWFREVMNNGAVLTPEECVKQLGAVPPGAFLFILKNDGGEPAKYKPDGLGNADHIGICTGQGEGAIHSSASRGCVAESRFAGKTIHGGWNRVGLWNKVSYDYAASVPASPGGPELRSGGTAVVFSENGKPVNTRKGPGTQYALSGAGKIPVGAKVEILSRKGGWARVRCADERGARWFCWMMEAFLLPENPEETEALENRYTVTVPSLTEAQAEELLRSYAGAKKTKEV